jgi:hypothetical protein
MRQKGQFVKVFLGLDLILLAVDDPNDHSIFKVKRFGFDHQLNLFPSF